MNQQAARRASVALMATLLLGAGARGQVNVTVDQAPVQFVGQGPVEQDGRVLVPLRGVLEKLGANVSYDAQNQTVRAVRDQTDILLTVGSGKASVSGREITLDAPTALTNGSVLVPLRFVSENLGAEVDWDAATRTVAIETPKSGSGNADAANAATLSGGAGTGMTSGTGQTSPPGPSAQPEANSAAPGTAMPQPEAPSAAAPTPATPAPAMPAPATPAPPVVVDTAPETTAGPDWGRWLPWILGALVLLGLAAYLMMRGRSGGQVIASKGNRTNP